MHQLGDITVLLQRWGDGDEAARDSLLKKTYEELRQVARRQRRQWSGDYTLNPTSLVHEIYLKLSEITRLEAVDRGHFYLIAGKAMRRILLDYAKARRRQKRGGDVTRVPIDLARDVAEESTASVEDILSVDAALERLATLSPRLEQVAALHFFGGLTYDEIAEALGVTKRTVTRDWVKAKGWLLKELREPESDS